MSLFKPEMPSVDEMSLEEIVQEGRDDRTLPEGYENPYADGIGTITSLARQFKVGVHSAIVELRGDDFDTRYAPKLEEWDAMLNSGDDRQIAIMTNQMANLLSICRFKESIPLWKEYSGKPLLYYLYAIMRPADLDKIDRIEKIDNGGKPCTPCSGGPAFVMTDENEVLARDHLIGELDGYIHMLSCDDYEIVAVKKAPGVRIEWV